MKKVNELKYTQLKNECKLSLLPFDTTKDINGLSDIIGQEAGINALEFGASIDVKGYKTKEYIAKKKVFEDKFNLKITEIE